MDPGHRLTLETGYEASEWRLLLSTHPKFFRSHLQEPCIDFHQLAVVTSQLKINSEASPSNLVSGSKSVSKGGKRGAPQKHTNNLVLGLNRVFVPRRL